MNNCEKLLRAFIGAKGYEIKEHTETENIIQKGKGACIFGGGTPDVCYVKTTTDYKVTEKNGKQDMLTQMSLSLVNALSDKDTDIHTVIYNDISMKYDRESKTLKVIDNEKV